MEKIILHFCLLESKEWLVMEKNNLYPLNKSLEFMLKVILIVLLTNHLLKNVFDVTLFSNFKASLVIMDEVG